MGVKEFFKISKTKIIIFSIFAIFEILIQFLNHNNFFSVCVLLFDTTISIPAEIVYLSLIPFLGSGIFGIIAFVIVNIIWFYTLTYIIAFFYEKTKSKKKKGQKKKPSKFLNFIKFSWLKLILSGIFLFPVILLVTFIFGFGIISLPLLYIELIRNINPGFNGSFFFVDIINPLLYLAAAYLTACLIESIYRKEKSKIFFYIAMGIGFLIDILLIIVALFWLRAY
jgi:hypothetical protein